jgi:two-component system LytT family sensor kinase
VVMDQLTLVHPTALVPASATQEESVSAVHPSARVSWKLILGIWTAYGLLASAQQDLLAFMNGRHVSVLSGLALQVPQAWCWAALTPVVLWLGRRLPLRGPGWPLRVLVHILIAAVIVFLVDAFFAFYTPIVDPTYVATAPLLRRAVRTFAWFFAVDSVLYWGILALGIAVDEAAQSRSRDLQRSELAGQLATARLSALKMQLHPHFLFNALHTVGALVRTGEKAPAVQVVARLGDLLRTMLDSAMTQEVSLREELEFIKGYLDIEQIRFHDRLSVRWEVETGILDTMVPHMILQPLVENALRHGITPQEAGGVLVIAAHAREELLELTVTDNGRGLSQPGGGSMTGVGLANTRLRLAQLYGPGATLEVTDVPPEGVQARVVVPLRGRSAK